MLLAALGCSESPAAPRTGASGAGQLAMLNALGAGDQASLKVDGDAVALYSDKPLKDAMIVAPVFP